MSRPRSWSDSIGESAPVSGCETIYWDSSLIFFFIADLICGIQIIFIFKSVATRIPDLTRLANPSWSPVYSDVFNYLSKTCCLCYSIFDLLIKQKHFLSGNPMTIYNFKTPITFTFNKMHLQNDAFLPCPCNVKDTYTNTLFNTIVSLFGL